MDKFNEFIELAKKLNEIEMIPLLRGSVGLEVITGISWGAQDLDIHVHGDKHNGCLMWHLIPPCKFTLSGCRPAALNGVVIMCFLEHFKKTIHP